MEGRAPRKHRNLEERTRIYEGTKSLHLQGKTHSEIAAQLGISYDEVGYWLRAGPPHVERYTPDLTPRPELAYLVGAYLGDGRTAGPNDKKVRFHVADSAFARILNETIATILQTQPRKITMDHGFLSVVYDAAMLYDYLQQPLESLVSVIDSFPAKFLQGFFDAEGYASPLLNHSTCALSGLRVGVANTNMSYLSCVKKLLEDLGIHPKYHKTHSAGESMTIRGKTFVRKHEVYHLVIGDFSELVDFQEKIGFSIPAKKEKLSDIIRILTSADSWEAYEWWVSHYDLRNRRWIKHPENNKIAE